MKEPILKHPLIYNLILLTDQLPKSMKFATQMLSLISPTILEIDFVLLLGILFIRQLIIILGK
jgi:hypothetical protein